MQIEVYSKDKCIYCEMTKIALTELRLPFLEHKLNVDFNRDEILAKFPEQSTFPYIVIDNKLIGGHTDLLEYLKGVYSGT